MPPVCTPDKYNNSHCNEIENGKQFLEFVTPPNNTTNSYLLKKNDKKCIEKIQKEFPALCRIFNIHKKVGEGTFSTVFMGTLNEIPASDKSFAIKYLVPTTHPKRIEVELHCLKQIGGTDNVAGLDLCLREKDNIVFIMPFLQHDHFGDYVKDMDAKEVAFYIKNLLRALSRVHSFGIIHRDIKPNNFLYDRQNKKFLLIDFGLAQLCSTTQTSNTPKGKREVEENDIETSQKPGPPAKRQALQTKNLNSLSSVISHLQKYESNSSSSKENLSSHSVTPVKVTMKKSQFKFPSIEKGTPETIPKSGKHFCRCYGKPKICTICIVRRGQDASRAGTPGFRPPEVLLKYDRQTTAVDLWAVGIIMLSILSGSYPFFQAPDDITALAEIITLFGDESIKKLAKTFGRDLICSEKKAALNIREVCCRLRARGKSKSGKCASCVHKCVCSGEQLADVEDMFPASAYDLLNRFLDVNPATRITAAQALNHPFLADY